MDLKRLQQERGLNNKQGYHHHICSELVANEFKSKFTKRMSVSNCWRIEALLTSTSQWCIVIGLLDHSKYFCAINYFIELNSLCDSTKKVESYLSNVSNSYEYLYVEINYIL